MDAATYTRLEEHLVNVSRSFALGIQAMDSPLRERICHAYLVCRILDTVEDYAEVPAARRVELLTRGAYELFDPARRAPLLADIRAAFEGVPITDGERGLLDDMELVFEEYDAFGPDVRARMEPNLREMSLGMARFVATEDERGTAGFGALGDLVHYCHFVAGVVGTLLTDQFVLAIGEDLPIGLQGELHSYADSFGIGLQLVNVLKNVGDDARRNVSFIPRVLTDRAGAKLTALIDAPESGPSRRFVLDLTSIALAFLARAVEYTNRIPAGPGMARGVRHFLALPLVFALKTLRLGIAHPSFAFHEQQLKITRDDVRRVQQDVEAALDDAAAMARLLQAELDAARADLQEALKDAPAPLRNGQTAAAGSLAPREESKRDLSSVINLFLMTFEDPREWRDTMRAAQPDATRLPHTADAAAPGETLARALEWLHANRDPQTGNHWSGLVEASPALNAQAIFLGRALGIFDAARLNRLADYLRHVQQADGSWAIFAGGDGHFDTSVFCHLGLVAMADAQDADRLQKSATWIREQAREKAPGFELRFVLALLGLWPWSDIPALSPVVMLPTAAQAFSRFDFAYWIRIALVPMTILVDRRYQLTVPGLTADSLRAIGIDPLTAARRTPKEQEQFDRWEDLVGRMTERLALQREDLERIGVAHAERIVLTRQDRDGSWGGIYPGIQYSLLALHALGHRLDETAGAGSPAAKAVAALRQYQHTLPRAEGGSLIQESCQSPVWDTAWTLFAAERAGQNLLASPWRDAIDWTVDQQILIEGDWAERTRLGFGGGWAFQYENAFYPDVDDSALVLCVLASALSRGNHTGNGNNGNNGAWGGRAKAASAARIGLRWLLAMQNDDGGWAAFERGVDNDLMREVPMNDLDNWLDPSTADVTGRCLMALGRFGFTEANSDVVRRALKFLRKDQAKSGAWWGRWGVNYIYGTWSVLTGLEAIGFDMNDPMAQKAGKWLLRCQNADGGWGETCESYDDPTCAGQGDSTASQTAWALLGITAAGLQTANPAAQDAIARGVEWLTAQQTADGTWHEAAFTGTGFPRAFYLRYHLYRHYFPVLALADVAARARTSGHAQG